MSNRSIHVPVGVLSNTDAQEEAAARERKKLREALLQGKSVSVNQSGEIKDRKDPNETAIVVPEGKLAANFYWYENDRELYQAEVQAMRKFYPQFTQAKLSDGRIYWHGALRPQNLRPGAEWYLQAVYDHNHPSNSSYGGSVKVYSIEPDLQVFRSKLGAIPHTLTDSSGNIYLCTARKEDFRTSAAHSTSAASALGWAAKWIAAFELWMAGDLTTAQFSGHSI